MIGNVIGNFTEGLGFIGGKNEVSRVAKDRAEPEE